MYDEAFSCWLKTRGNTTLSMFVLNGSGPSLFRLSIQSQGTGHGAKAFFFHTIQWTSAHREWVVHIFGPREKVFFSVWCHFLLV